MDKPVVLRPGEFYRLSINGKHYPNVTGHLLDESGNKLYRLYFVGESFWLTVDASEVLAGRTVQVEIKGAGSVHFERPVNAGYIVAAYNKDDRRFEIRLKERMTSASYLVIGRS